MRVINKPNSLALRKARWLGICLFSSLLSAAPWLYAQSDGKTAEDNHGPFLLSTDLDLEIELIVSHMIRAYSVTGKNKIELSVDSDHTASGSQNYCVDSNGREAKTYLTVNSEDASGNQFRLIKESGSTTLNMDVFITDHLNGETKKTGGSRREEPDYSRYPK